MSSGISRVGVVGSGAMGRGIAQICALSGKTVMLFDAGHQVVEKALAGIAQAISIDVQKGRLDDRAAQQAAKALIAIDNLEALRDCELVIEAITEDLDAKLHLLSSLDDVVDASCILASNTSSLSITSLASKCRYPGRVAGMHFFNPVPRMRLVEVIRGLKTEDAVIAQLKAVGHDIGKEVVEVNDTPGFLVNQIGRGYTLEAVNVVAEGVASYAQIDQIMREAAGFRMGPFELLDLVGLDVNHPATELIYNQLFQEPRYRPSSLMSLRLQAGTLGRKTGEGYYRYEVGAPGKHGAKPLQANLPAPSAPHVSAPVWVSSATPEAGDTLRALASSLGASIEAGTRPSDKALCLVTPMGRDASRTAAIEGLDPVRTVAVDTLFGLQTHRTLMTTCVTSRAWRDMAHAIFSADGVPVTVIRDSPGFVAQRIVAMIMNIGGALAQSRTAAPQDIDRAVVLALAYPHGPLGFANRLGAASVSRLLDGLYESFRDPRYRPALWLARRAALDMDFCEGD
ncbi:3-hydroxyacyl-CoA dehydrogenase [Allopusillimonas ginsengisoli]|uniref:3-hydroxyacyl-CoA dehydrogenase n=1 Tax=Allopusillimonas ginsengisoli TaxID=453575 RepID=UPI001020E7BE|nr:3-hydroxyacyl-CoA dehydrogenase [Allopusillimonas ginsengisoli]TEA77902.1 3-hydroxyacyl-CoA dehydrogenase [Allopusillimonas ginsengisoli]